MFHKFLAAGIISLATPVLASDTDPHCSRTGDLLSFCGGDEYTRIDHGHQENMSLWMHPDGVMSKVLVQDSRRIAISRSVIEQRIIAGLNARADANGRVFEFLDINSSTVNGRPFGTLTYRFGAAKNPTTVLHSYVVFEGVLVQVLSQIAPQNETSDAAGLKAAHGETLAALQRAEPLIEM